jgi:hypothetical protein
VQKNFLHANGSSRKWSAVLFFCLAFASVVSASAQAPPSRVLVEGEELKYNVRYGPIDIGQVRIVTTKKVAANGSTAFQTFAYIDSYKGIPFVNLHAVFESVFDSVIFSRYFFGKSKDGDYYDFARYRYDYEKKLVAMESGKRDTIVEKRDTLKLDGGTQDGLSLFFYARDQLFSARGQNIAAVVKEKRVNTFIDFDGRRKTIEQDLIDYPVDCVGFEGKAEFTGIFGLTGEFEGWFSNDDARVPIMAKMKVIIGSVTLELMEWKRGGWKPPAPRP